MAGFFQDLLNGAAGTFFGSDYLRDYTHAAKTFRPNAYQNAPKLKFLFHVYFDINTEAYAQNENNGNNFALAVKTIKLPSFSFDTHVLNQYNRKRIVQTKIKYEPIDISFHDDNGGSVNSTTSGGMIRRLWQAYYNYYYYDGQNASVVFSGARGSSTNTSPVGGGAQATPTLAEYNKRNQYDPSITNNASWGYNSQPVLSNSSGVKVPFFKNITVFGFNQHNWASYTLINPIITRFDHDTYSYAESAGTMENKMSINYETVLYNTGALSGNAPGNQVPGFGSDANYDRRLSPIARPGSNATILGQGGLVDGANGVVSALQNGDIIGAIQAAGTTYNTFSNPQTNLSSIIKSEVTAGLGKAITDGASVTRNVRVNIPIYGSSPNNQGSAGAPQGTATAPQPIGDTTNAGTTNP
jgi:hypothetical protein